MEARGSLPRAGVPASALPELAEALARPGPFVTVVADADASGTPTGAGTQAWWRDARARLAASGAPGRALEALDEVVDDAHLAGAGLAAVANESGVVTVVAHDEPPASDLAVVGALARVAPFLRWYQSRPPMVVVLTDRTGAEIVVRREGDEQREEVVTAAHDDPLIRRSEPGGWSQQRFQQKAEERWRSSAEEVGARLTEVADRVGARLVVVAGDVRAVQLLQGQLPSRLAPLVQVADGGRHAGGAQASAFAEAHRMLATVVASDTVVVAEKLKEELGQHDQGVTGVRATIEALRLGAVDTLLLHDDDRDDTSTLWFGAGPLTVGTADEVRAMGEEPHEGRLQDVLVRAAWGSGATVRVVPGLSVLEEDVGALLRFPLPST